MPNAMSDQIREVFESHPAEYRAPLLELRSLIFDVADLVDGVGPLMETLKWGQVSYVTEESGSGTTVRVDRFGASDIAVFVHCRTSLIGTFRGLFPDLVYSGNRAIVLSPVQPIPVEPLRALIEMALTYKRQN